MNPFALWASLAQALTTGHWPGSGDLQNYQDIRDQWGLINISTTSSGDPALERDINWRVASYGRQLGWITDALGVLIDNKQVRSEDEKKAIEQFNELRDMIKDAKDNRTRDRCDRTVQEVQELANHKAFSAGQLQELRDAIGAAARV